MVLPEDEALPDFKETIRFEPREIIKYFEVHAVHAVHAVLAGSPRPGAASVGWGWRLILHQLPPACCHPSASILPLICHCLLRCCLQSGEHVKVVHGQHEGETGMVVRVEGPVCYIFTDATQAEIRVFVRDLTLAVATASSIDS